jgi:hypothetical protein
MLPQGLLGLHPMRTSYSPNMAPARDLAAGAILDLGAALERAMERVLAKSSVGLNGYQGLVWARNVCVTAARPL